MIPKTNEFYNDLCYRGMFYVCIYLVLISTQEYVHHVNC